MNRNNFLIKAGSFVTCFSRVSGYVNSMGNQKHCIAYTTLFNTSLNVDIEVLNLALSKMGIDSLVVFSIYRKHIDDYVVVDNNRYIDFKIFYMSFEQFISEINKGDLPFGEDFNTKCLFIFNDCS